DFQFLFAEDILGNNPPPYPRHSKQYKELHKLKAKMQEERVAGFKAFIGEVRNGSFPKPEHVIKAPEGLIDSFKKSLTDD
ncbi:MAG: 3-methyl-2-oxobutanoate hydroxymethyltransferase, partial [Proteobacteria bacterium]|nr:3-methyl-2-oxobutanoate hydroxymethyltransferase [Pseudomonadota bacterium]